MSEIKWLKQIFIFTIILKIPLTIVHHITLKGNEIISFSMVFVGINFMIAMYTIFDNKLKLGYQIKSSILIDLVYGLIMNIYLIKLKVNNINTYAISSAIYFISSDILFKKNMFKIICIIYSFINIIILFVILKGNVIEGKNISYILFYLILIIIMIVKTTHKGVTYDE